MYHTCSNISACYNTILPQGIVPRSGITYSRFTVIEDENIDPLSGLSRFTLTDLESSEDPWVQVNLGETMIVNGFIVQESNNLEWSAKLKVQAGFSVSTLNSLFDVEGNEVSFEETQIIQPTNPILFRFCLDDSYPYQ